MFQVIVTGWGLQYANLDKNGHALEPIIPASAKLKKVTSEKKHKAGMTKSSP